MHLKFFIEKLVYLLMPNSRKLGDYKVESSIVNGPSNNMYIVCKNKKKYIAQCDGCAKGSKTFRFDVKIHELLKKSNSSYFPQYVSSGFDGGIKFFVTELYGPSLRSILDEVNGKFSESDALRIGYHLFMCIKALHQNAIIHRDINPKNIVVSIQHDHPIKLTNFGASRIYMVQQKHSEEREFISFRGSSYEYASINAMKGKDVSRCDDLISWFYVLSEMLFGKLPWASLTDKEEILNQKINFNFNLLYSEYPQLLEIWNSLQNLKFKDRPKYDYIENILKNVLREKALKFEESYVWEYKGLKLKVKNLPSLAMNQPEPINLDTEFKEYSSSSRPAIMEKLRIKIPKIKSKEKKNFKPLLTSNELFF